jgi:hypothetical protein
MSPRGTAAYDGLTDLPPLVAEAVRRASQAGFANSCRPEHGRLLFALASGAEVIGETGTGCGVGLAWLASGARSGDQPADPSALLRPGGALVVDDLTPADQWPPRFDGRPDAARLHWLTHRDLAAAELRLAPDLAALVATRRWPQV